MVWGGIWYNGKTELAIVEGSINYKKYIDVLANYLLPSMPTSNQFVFQQDNARPHTVRSVYDWMLEHAVRVLDPWPAYSPDFNPIEHVWSWMSQYVAKERPLLIVIHSSKRLIDHGMQFLSQSFEGILMHCLLDSPLYKITVELVWISSCTHAATIVR